MVGVACGLWPAQVCAQKSDTAQCSYVVLPKRGADERGGGEHCGQTLNLIHATLIPCCAFVCTEAVVLEPP